MALEADLFLLPEIGTSCVELYRSTVRYTKSFSIDEICLTWVKFAKFYGWCSKFWLTKHAHFLPG
jgi:hypothetical protein